MSEIKWQRPLLLLLSLLLFLLIGCTQMTNETAVAQLPTFPAPPTLETPTIELPQPTLSPSATPRGRRILFAAPLLSPTQTATKLPAVVPTVTQSPTPSPTPCPTSGQMISGTYESSRAGASPYRIYLPPCYESNGRFYPTLYLLPGNIHSDAIWDILGADEIAEAAIQAGDMPPFLMVMTAHDWVAQVTSGGEGSLEQVILEDLIPYIEETYCAWPNGNGRAIGGISRGGYWALEIAFRNAAQFASVGGHSAALWDLYAGPDINPQHTGLEQDLGDLRIYFDAGEYDGVRYNLEKLNEDMDAADIPNTWVLNEGRHNDAYWRSHVAEYLTWYSEPWSLDRSSYPKCDLTKSTPEPQVRGYP